VASPAAAVPSDARGGLASDFRQRFTQIDARLGAATVVERDALKADIVALFKAVDAEVAELTALREAVKGLVDRWKALPESRPSLAPQFAADRPIVADHLGASTFIEKGWSRISTGDYVGAEEALNRALALAPEDPQSESLLGWAQMLQEKYDEALMNFQRVLMRQPANALARINVGYICLKKGIFGEAIEHLSKAIRLDNDRKATLYAHLYLGMVYLEREMYEDANAFFEKTLLLGPNLIEAYYEMGRSHWFAGDQDRARATWRAGFAANKFNPWGKRCAELLETVDAGGSPPRSA
jgi:tetratricopeptide (TPR) repeat protein